MIIGICGFATSGKDSIADILIELNSDFKRYAFADSLRSLAMEINPYFQEIHMDYKTALLESYDIAKLKYPIIRDFLVTLGEGCRNNIHQDVWVESVVRKIDTNFPSVITDVRYPNEAEKIKSLGGIIWKVERNGVFAANITEGKSIELIEFDVLIQNNGNLDDLKNFISKIL